VPHCRWLPRASERGPARSRCLGRWSKYASAIARSATSNHSDQSRSVLLLPSTNRFRTFDSDAHRPAGSGGQCAEGECGRPHQGSPLEEARMRVLESTLRRAARRRTETPARGRRDSPAVRCGRPVCHCPAAPHGGRWRDWRTEGYSGVLYGGQRGRTEALRADGGRGRTREYPTRSGAENGMRGRIRTRRVRVPNVKGAEQHDADRHRHRRNGTEWRDWHG
jgi:hypothetical protein